MVEIQWIYILHLCKVSNEMVTNLHKTNIQFIDNIIIKGDQNELQLTMVEKAEKCN